MILRIEKLFKIGQIIVPKIFETFLMIKNQELSIKYMYKFRINS